MRSAFIFMLVIFIFIPSPFIFITVRLIFKPIPFIFIPIRFTYMVVRNVNLKGMKTKSGNREKKGHHITAVSRNGEAWDLSEIGKVFN